MAGYRDLRMAKQAMSKIQKQGELVTKGLDFLGEGAAYAQIQSGKVKDAWGEAKAGYEQIGGDPSEWRQDEASWLKKLGQTLMPGGKKGFFQKPEGDVRVGATMYDLKNLQKLGKFKGTLGGDIAAFGDDSAFGDILGRYQKAIAPGRAMTSKEVSTTRESLRPKTPYKESYDVDEEFSYTAESPVYQQGQEPGLSTVGQDWATPMQYGQDEPFQETEAGGGGVDPKPRGMSLLRRWKQMGGFKGYGGGKGYGDDAGPLYKKPEDKRYTPYKSVQETYEDQKYYKPISYPL